MLWSLFCTNCELTVSEMASIESKLHNYMWQLHFLILPDTEIDEPFFETIFGQVDKKTNFWSCLIFPFDLVLAKIEKFRSSFRSKVNNSNNFLAWTTYFSSRFQQEIEHFNPFRKSETLSMLDQLNCKIFHHFKELHESDPL